MSPTPSPKALEPTAGPDQIYPNSGTWIFPFGVPDHWVSKFDSDYYNGKALADDGTVIENKFSEGDFAGAPIDPDDPPRYESQAAYLERHGLLLPGERERLSEADFEPEAVEPPEDDDCYAPDDALADH